MVKLLSYTKPVVHNYSDISVEEYIIYIARVSSTRKDKTKDHLKLLKYLIENKHWSPFEHVSFSFEITTSIAIATQMLRHRSAYFQQFSQRYATAMELEPIQFRLKGDSNRQGSLDDCLNDLTLDAKVINHLSDCLELYSELIEAGVSNECARNVLPQCTKTTIIMTNNIRGWLHYLELRLDSHTQKEHRQVAEGIKEILTQHVPNIMKLVDIQ